MTAKTVKEETLDLIVSSPQEREKIVRRILSLSDEQFDRLIVLCAQQGIEFYPVYPDPRQTSA